MNVWGITDRGVIREQNQDAFAHQVLPDGRVLALVCDGMVLRYKHILTENTKFS